jgi:hypothetical protein
MTAIAQVAIDDLKRSLKKDDAPESEEVKSIKAA